MSGKSKMKFWCVVMALVLLLGGLGWFLFSNGTKVDVASYAQKAVPSQSVPSPRNANVTARTESKESVQHVVDRLNINFRAISLNGVSSDANQELAFNVLNEMRSSPYFDATNIVGVGGVSPEFPLSEPPVKAEGGETPGTFSFKIVAKLKRPLTL